LPSIRLQLSFQPEPVNQLLRRTSSPIWPNNRPSVIVWLVIEDDGGKRMINSEAEDQAAEQVRNHMGRRGVPLVLPIGDLEDQLLVGLEDIWAHRKTALVGASDRYGADSVLSGRVFKTFDGRWVGDWIYLDNDRQVPFEGNAQSLSEFVARGANQVAEILSAQYAVVSRFDQAAGISLRVTGVSGFTGYQEVMAYLKNLTSVQQAFPATIRGDELLIRIQSDVVLEDLQKEIGLGQRLVAEPVITVGLGDETLEQPYATELRYRWQVSP
jgi:hypothetical protein